MALLKKNYVLISKNSRLTLRGTLFSQIYRTRSIKRPFAYWFTVWVGFWHFILTRGEQKYWKKHFYWIFPNTLWRYWITNKKYLLKKLLNNQYKYYNSWKKYWKPITILYWILSTYDFQYQYFIQYLKVCFINTLEFDKTQLHICFIATFHFHAIDI